MNALYKKEDFSNDNEVRWCPGCGDYAILAALQKALPEMGRAPEEHVFVSGIGCAGRLPYYMNGYGFHTIHGRALAVATGLKAMRDDLSVWVITGDGDALSIGGNHFIHCLRRNVNLTILLFNNQVYGLTKGQFSPTSPEGQVTKTSPDGVSGQAVNPLLLALASKASFVARGVDKDPAHLATLLQQAHAHQGCSIVEIYQDCNIFNNGAFDSFALKPNRAEHTVYLEEGEALCFGKEKEQGFYQRGDEIYLDHGTSEAAMIHDSSNWEQAMRLARLSYPDYPVPLGVYYQEQRPVFELKTSEMKQPSDLSRLFSAKGSWRQD